MRKDYKKGSAGMLVNKRVPLVFEDQLLEDVRRDFFKKAREFETVNYLYAVDQNLELKGVLSIKEILGEGIKGKVSEIMERNVIKVEEMTDQEEVALLALKHNIKAVPVVDKNNKFLGVIDSDTILAILYKESSEDIFLAGGFLTDPSVLENASAKSLVLIRSPWLLIGLLGGVVAAHIIGAFEDTLQSLITLAFFIPIIVYLSDAVSTQSATIFIRGMALNRKMSLLRYFFREIKVGALLGLFLGAILSFIAFIGWNDPRLSIILLFSVFGGILFSVFFAITVPLLLLKMKRDPAVGTNPLATIISDVLSIAIYLLIAKMLLSI